MLRHLRRLALHLRWADDRILDRLRENPEPDGVRLLAHVVGAGRIWLTRLEGADSGRFKVWPEWSLEETAEQARAVHADLERYLGELDEALLDGSVTYRNQTGREFTTNRLDILTHLMMHGTYHRGQIARPLRPAGHEPINTDFVTWVREADSGGAAPLSS